MKNPIDNEAKEEDQEAVPREGEMDEDLREQKVQSTMLTVHGDYFLEGMLQRSSSFTKLHRSVADVRRWRSGDTLRAGPLSAAEVKTAKVVWVKWAQSTMEEDMMKSESHKSQSKPGGSCMEQE